MADVETVLDEAGSNRVELEKVLAYYGKKPKDSLKLKAAYYLIANMKGVYYLKSPSFESFSGVFTKLAAYDGKLMLSKLQFKNKEIRRRKFDELWESHERQVGKPNRIGFMDYTDAETMSASMLIENIEYAFKAWDFPWSKHYTFDQFCKFILPYRYGNEALTPWRAYYFKKLSPVVDSLRNQNNPLVVARAINNWLAIDYWGSLHLKDYPRGTLKPIDLLTGRIAGICNDQAGLGSSVMRAVGIATSKIVIPTWGSHSPGHEVSAVLDTAGKWFHFHAGDGPIKDPVPKISAPKLFLQTFNGNYPNVPFPVSKAFDFNYLNGFTDVTDLYNTTTDITSNLPHRSPTINTCTCAPLVTPIGNQSILLKSKTIKSHSKKWG